MVKSTKVLLFVAVVMNAVFAYSNEIKVENETMTVKITDFSRIFTSKLPGYISIDLGDLKYLHFRKDQICFVREDPNEIIAYISFSANVEVIADKKVKLVIIRFPYSLDKIKAKELLRN